MNLKNGFKMSLTWIGLSLSVALTCAAVAAPAAEKIPAGEVPFENVQDERPHYLRLLSGKLFRVSGENHSETSADAGTTWQRGGRVNPFTIGWKLNDVAIQL